MKKIIPILLIVLLIASAIVVWIAVAEPFPMSETMHSRLRPVRSAALKARRIITGTLVEKGLLPESALQETDVLPAVVEEEERKDLVHDLSMELAKAEYKHIVEFTDGRVVRGDVVSDTEDYVAIKEKVAGAGFITSRFPKNQIVRISEADQNEQPITEKEIAIKNRFPELFLYRFGEYSFFSDGGYYFVESSAERLTRLRKGFMEEFGELFPHAAKMDRSYVVVFHHEDEYLDFAAGLDAHLENSLGFYAADAEILAFYDLFEGDEWKGQDSIFSDLKAQLKDQKDAVLAEEGIDEDKTSKAFSAAQGNLAASRARQMSSVKQEIMRITLHEGAHQLWYATGVHDNRMGSVHWLAEGLATYCETPRFGEVNRERLDVLREAFEKGTYEPLEWFVSNRKPLLSSDREKSHLLYCEAWGLVYFLENSHYRESFRNWLSRLAVDPQYASKELTAESFAEAMQTSLDFLEQEWKNYMYRL
ncbi:MAG: DUF1570 domain-containing protein [Candidatus Omnitrophica bacterium]|nr:DUF1570 domain-containing protein [Candidatus Omnitrophota bacterium]